MFVCRFCGHKSGTISKHLSHYHYHRNLTKHFHCDYNGCRHFFGTSEGLKRHVIRFHQLSTRKNCLQTNNFQCVQDFAGKFVCSVEVCKKQLDSYQLLLKHLKGHIRSGMSVKCPYNLCQHKSRIVSSFTGHLAKFHKIRLTKNNSNNDVQVITDKISISEECLNTNPDLQVGMEGGSQPSVTVSGPPLSCDSEAEIEDGQLCLQNVAEFYLKLESELMIPASTIQHIVTQVENIQGQGVHKLKHAVRQKLLAENVSEDITARIIKEIDDQNIFANIFNTFKTNYRRKKFYKRNMNFVEPQEVEIGMVSGKMQYFHYVPLISTLKALFFDKSVDMENCYVPENKENVMADFTDGSVFKSNDFFSENPGALQLILYQDSFEVVNPIGPARNKHKIVAVYLSVGNLPDFVRLQTNKIQLVALCKEKHFDHEKVYGRIVKDLKVIEENGVEISENKIVKGALVFICGDNLGSHSLGGFIENFSTSQYFCRYCLIQRKQFSKTGKAVDKCGETHVGRRQTTLVEVCADNEDSLTEHEEISGSENDSFTDSEDEHEDKSCSYQAVSYKKRTVESYIMSVTKVKFGKHVLGVKFDSCFNKLSHFHVCNPGLPPCLGHDLMEGCIAYDLSLFVEYFVNKKYFTYSTLNERIKHFHYSTCDLRDKPADVIQKGKRIIGGAWQVWTLLRLFSLLIGDKIEDKCDDVWLCLLKLTEIVEIVCAPVIHKSYCPYLQMIIDDYLSARLSLFPLKQLRPKHHYLAHYPRLILEFGPLMKVWTLRFESKHSFFKRIIRYSHNFKNITMTLSEKHELYQSLMRSGAGLRSAVDIYNEIPCDIRMYSADIQHVVCNAGLIDSVTECSRSKWKGTTYTKGDIVTLLTKKGDNSFHMGKIVLLLCDEHQKIYFVVDICVTTFHRQLRLYEIGGHIKYECVQVDELLDYEPLHAYVIDTVSYVQLKHGLVSQML